MNQTYTAARVSVLVLVLKLRVLIQAGKVSSFFDQIVIVS